MKLLATATLAIALFACSSKPETPPVETDAADPELASVAGMTFDIEGEDGVERTAFAADGRYTDWADGRESGRGTYEEKSDGQLCFTPDDPDAATECWTMEGPPDAEGWATSVRVSDGQRIRVRPTSDAADADAGGPIAD